MNYGFKPIYAETKSNDPAIINLRYTQNALPCVISGELQEDLKETINQCVVVYTKRDNLKALKNKLFNHPQITIHDDGKNEQKKRNKYFIIYTYSIKVIEDLTCIILIKLRNHMA